MARPQIQNAMPKLQVHNEHPSAETQEISGLKGLIGCGHMISEQIDVFLSFLRDCEQQYHMADADEQEANSGTQDILHSLELEEHDYRDFARLSKELREVRRKRRSAMDLKRITAPVLDWLDENKDTVKSLERLLGDVRKAERSTENRIYTPRTKK